MLHTERVIQKHLPDLHDIVRNLVFKAVPVLALCADAPEDECMLLHRLDILMCPR